MEEVKPQIILHFLPLGMVVYMTLIILIFLKVMCGIFSVPSF